MNTADILIIFHVPVKFLKLKEPIRRRRRRRRKIAVESEYVKNVKGNVKQFCLYFFTKADTIKQLNLCLSNGSMS